MLLSVSKRRAKRRRLAIFAVALLFVAGGPAPAQGPTSAGSENRLLADAGHCYSATQDMAISVRGYVQGSDRPLTPALRKQIDAIDKLAKAVFRADAVLPTLSAAVAAAGPDLSSDPVLRAALERVARLKSEVDAAASKDDGVASSPHRAPVQEAASDRAELADIFIEPECRAIISATVIMVGDVVKTVLVGGVAPSSTFSDADLRKELSSIADEHEPYYTSLVEGSRGAAKFWYGAVLNALSPEEVAALKRYHVASGARRTALVNAYREAMKNATAQLLFDYVKGNAAGSP